MPELRTARENARLEIGSQRGRNSHQIGVLGIYDLQGLSYGRTELLVAGMRLLECGGGDPGPGLLLAGSYPKDGLQPGPHRGQTAGTRHRTATRGGEATGIRQRAPAGGQGQGGGATGGL